jgi:hypothetical protein
LEHGLIGLAVLILERKAWCRPQVKERSDRAEQDEIVKVQTQARAAKLGQFAQSQSDHFLALGDAPDSYRQTALRLCEELAKAFLSHFRGRGFTVEYPDRRMTIITLKSADSYAALLGNAPGKDVGGHYDLETNRLVIFDFRPDQASVNGQAERVNLFTLVHETSHQLCFNTGVQKRNGQWPLCISEGLATYVEMWRPRVRNAIGGINRPRLEALRDASDWIPIADLLADDKPFEDDRTTQIAYAESWVLMHHLLTNPTRRSGLRAYLTGSAPISKQDDHRNQAEKSLGPLDKLDRVAKTEADRLLRELNQIR